MGIGAGVFLMALGAILTFAVDVTISGLDIAVVGIILMLAGAVGLVLELAVFAPRRRRALVTRSDVDVYPEAGAYEEPPAQALRVHRRTTRQVDVPADYDVDGRAGYPPVR
ncbi:MULTISPECIES: DUF6458 family protein [Parafrankia]|uniref:DUF6458 domain-containing protein n=1 Tax=Parafrankia soli TaxID=2599596 RepID=A0A1S1Q3D9_9ACTN|nr:MULTISPECIES: DUF6458 family protein [Parafrankia]OHV28089.1 hypothetical protein BBK14_18315 [Parafrankia soli]TCJ35302.1 hypothetical protein E0504_27615 [Parafrankia sp. BMG5.11]CAI7977381.1 conserved hypothetical protein [Frankia sp. Hr75.2]SQE00802.1 conserved hypothetical protein [Parafrankia sp. Ea1.12]